MMEKPKNLRAHKIKIRKKSGTRIVKVELDSDLPPDLVKEVLASVKKYQEDISS